MKFDYNDYVVCNYLTDAMVEWVLDQMYKQARDNGGYCEEDSETFADFERDGFYSILVYALPRKSDPEPTIFFSGHRDLWGRDITMDVIAAYIGQKGVDVGSI